MSCCAPLQMTYIDATGDQTIAAAPGADKRIIVDRIIVTATAATTWIFKDTTATRWTMNCPASDTKDLRNLNINTFGWNLAATVTMPASGAPKALIYYWIDKRGNDA